MKPRLPVTGPYTAKDQRKWDAANKFIGRGSSFSSTNSYAKALGDAANCGWYVSTDVVFISAEGARKNRREPDFNEIKLACDAGCVFITDDIANRTRSYNVGERQVAKALTQHGYKEVQPGRWER